MQSVWTASVLSAFVFCEPNNTVVIAYRFGLKKSFGFLGLNNQGMN